MGGFKVQTSGGISGASTFVSSLVEEVQHSQWSLWCHPKLRQHALHRLV